MECNYDTICLPYHMTVGVSHDCPHLIGSDRILSLMPRNSTYFRQTYSFYIRLGTRLMNTPPVSFKEQLRNTSTMYPSSNQQSPCPARVLGCTDVTLTVSYDRALNTVHVHRAYQWYGYCIDSNVKKTLRSTLRMSLKLCILAPVLLA